MSLRADLVAASVVRGELAAWLLAHSWPPAHADDLVLVLSEAVTNSIQHGYGVGVDVYDHPGIVRVSADIHTSGSAGHRHVELTIADDGRWREPTRTPRPGHGLYLMKAIAARTIIDGTPHGTTVTMHSHPVSPPP